MYRESPSNAELLSWILDRLSRGVAVSLVTIVEKSGSAPRGVGTKMAVSEEGEYYGTLGGGELERIAIEKAIESIIESAPKTVRVNLFRTDVVRDDAVSTKSQICGGRVTIFIDVLTPPQKAYIIGAGHLARSLSMLLHHLGFKVIVLDNMPEYADKSKIPWADEIIIDKDLPSAVRALPFSERDIFVIMHGNADLELEVLYSIYSQSKAPRYVGLLSGRGKLAYILRGLVERGINKEVLSRTLYSPAGLSIGGESPEEIAVSIAAEIIKVTKNAQGVHESLVRDMLDKLGKGE